MIPFKTIVSLVDAHIQRGQIERDQWDRWHAWFLSEYVEAEGYAVDALPGGDTDSGNELSLETNYPYAFLDTMIANVCPTAPSVSCKARSDEKRKAAKARELLINDTFKKNKLAMKQWKSCTFAGICGRGVTRTAWHDGQKRPTTMVVDPRFFFFDLSAPEWDEVKYVAEMVAITQQEFDRRVASGKYDANVAKDIKGSAYPAWMQDKQRFNSVLTVDNRDQFAWVVICEFYDFVGDRFYHFVLDNKEAPLFAGPLPYKYVRNPYTPMIFNDNLRDLGGVADVKHIAKLQARLNEIDTLELRFAHASIPVPVVNKAAFDDPEAALSMFNAATGPTDVASVSLRENYTVDQAISYRRSPAITPSWDKMRELVTAKIEFILALPQYARGGYGGTNAPATEMALADTATKTRNGRRMQVVLDWTAEVAKKTLGIWKERMSIDRAMPFTDDATGTSIIADRISLAFPDPDPVTGALPADDFDDDWFEYEPVAYSPAENSRLVRLQALQQFLPALLQLPGVDPIKVSRELLELLDLDVAADPSKPPPGIQVPGAPGAPGMPGAPGSPVPPGTSQATEAVLPPDVRTGGGASAPIAEV